MTHLLYATFPLLGHNGPNLGRRHPEADAFALMTQRLSGARSVTRRVVPGQPAVMAFEVDRGTRQPTLVLWEERDAFFEEDAPPVLVEWTWSARTARAVDALGTPTDVGTYEGFIRVPVSVTPVFVTAEEQRAQS
ncbi:hypothetical protein [Actinopolymorpha pittospori]